MDGHRVQSQHPEYQRQTPRGLAGASEDHGGAARQLHEHVHHEAVLVLGRHEQVLHTEQASHRRLGLPRPRHATCLLSQSGNRLVLRRHFHFDWVAQAGALQLLHLRGHRGAVQLRAALARDHLYVDARSQQSRCKRAAAVSRAAPSEFDPTPPQNPGTRCGPPHPAPDAAAAEARSPATPRGQVKWTAWEATPEP